MAVASVGRSELQIPRKWKERELSPERKKVWVEPSKQRPSNERRVPVVYYLSRNGQLEHPHFMEVALSSSDGLRLRDVINRLNILRGKGMASMYSWSCKRSYKNGFVWHDLAENDFIHPAHGNEYVLKGSEILEPLSSSNETMPSKPEKPKEESEFPVITRRRNQSWSSTDMNEYTVYEAEFAGDPSRRLGADASTQTDDKRRRRRVKEEKTEQSTEIHTEEISPPPYDSSPETLETLTKADGRLVLCPGGGTDDGGRQTVHNLPSGRMKASAVLMQLLSCGSISFKDCGALAVRGQGPSLIGNYKGTLPRGAGNHAGKGGGTRMEIGSYSGVKLEDKEYFSGSLIETKKEEVPVLKRSCSYNGDRSSQLQVGEEGSVDGEEGVRAKCIPRKAKTVGRKKEGGNSIDNGCSVERGSKRFDARDKL